MTRAQGGIRLGFLRFVYGAEQQTGPAMRVELGYVPIAILWCLFVLGVFNLIELGAKTIHLLEGSLAPFCCSSAPYHLKGVRFSA